MSIYFELKDPETNELFDFFAKDKVDYVTKNEP